MIVHPANRQEVVIANEDVYHWYRTYNSSETTANAYRGKGEMFHPVGVVLKWDVCDDVDFYNVSYSLNQDLTDSETVSTKEQSLQLSNLLVGKTYYWRVDAIRADKTLQIGTYSFSTAESPRAVTIDGVKNTRDIGGYITENGKRVKQGMVYRGAHFKEMTDEGKSQALNIYKIKTDLDLRQVNENGDGGCSPLGSTVNYSNCTLYQYQPFNESYRENLKNAIEIFADESNYPVYTHCSLGRDRTGTLAFLLNGLLGVDKEYLCMDYDMSWFSLVVMEDNQTLPVMRVHYQGMYDEMMAYADGTLSQNIEKFLLDIGVSKEKIDAIKSHLLE